jgi:RNA polymerase sigma-70 factor (ECF subfamily)
MFFGHFLPQKNMIFHLTAVHRFSTTIKKMKKKIVLFNLFINLLNKINRTKMTALEFSYQVGNFSKFLKPFALRLTRDGDDANDLVQDTLVKAYTNRDKYMDGTNLKAWLFTIMKNTFITQYQRMVRRNTFIDTTENLHFINSSETVQINSAESTFMREDINLALSHTEEMYRVPFLMYFEGFKYHEIADELDLPIGTVKNRIHIARKSLKQHLQMYA